MRSLLQVLQERWDASSLTIDELRSARARREQYLGDWLPEPILTEAAECACMTAGSSRSPTGIAPAPTNVRLLSQTH